MPGAAFPIHVVDDLAATVAFYEGLGFRENFRLPPEGDVAFMTLERDGDVVGLATGDSDDRVAYWVYVEDVDAAFAGLTAAGAPVVEAPADQPWGERVASVRDPDGNLVHLGSRAEEA